MSGERKQAARTRLLNALTAADAAAVEAAADLLEGTASDDNYDPVKAGKEAAAREIAVRERAKDALR